MGKGQLHDVLSLYITLIELRTFNMVYLIECPQFNKYGMQNYGKEMEAKRSAVWP